MVKMVNMSKQNDILNGFYSGVLHADICMNIYVITFKNKHEPIKILKK